MGTYFNPGNESFRQAIRSKIYIDKTGLISELNDVLTALIHLGYLGYEKNSEEAYVPNFEVSTAFKAALTIGNRKEIAKSISRCEKLLRATINKEA